MDYLELIQSKIVKKDDLLPLLTYWKFKNYKIVFTNGCFDLLHRGHIEYLAKAAGFGDVLIIGVNTDKSVNLLKGNDRPVMEEESRKLILASLRFVTAVVSFDEETPFELIKLIKPDVLVKGSDYKENEIVGSDIVKKNGGKVIPVELTPGYSSSELIRKIKKS